MEFTSTPDSLFLDTHGSDFKRGRCTITTRQHGVTAHILSYREYMTFDRLASCLGRLMSSTYVDRHACGDPRLQARRRQPRTSVHFANCTRYSVPKKENSSALKLETTSDTVNSKLTRPDERVLSIVRLGAPNNQQTHIEKENENSLECSAISTQCWTLIMIQPLGGRKESPALSSCDRACIYSPDIHPTRSPHLLPSTGTMSRRTYTI